MSRGRARLHEGVRLAGVLLGTGFRAAPLTAWLSLVLSLAASVCSVVYTVGLKVMIDGALHRSGGRVALGAALVAVLFTLSWLLAVIAGSRGSLLTDKTSLALGVRIMRLAASLPTLEHFERPELLARLDTLTGGRRTLAGAPRQLINLLGQALRAIGMIVLLALIYPPVLAVPLLALAPAFADRRAGRVQRRADESLAEDRRMLDALFTLATTTASARELRTYGLTDALPARHAALARAIRRRAVRAAVVSAAWEAAGWVVFAAGLVAAIVVLVLRAAHGQVSPGSVVEAVTLLRRAQTQISRSTDTAGSFQTSLSAARELLWLEDHGAALDGARRPNVPRAGAPGSGRSPGASTPPAERPVPNGLELGIVFERVTFAYPGSDQTVLGPLDLELPAGASVALVGENGAGKTTLVKLLCGMYAPVSGRILIDGVELSAFALARWRERVSAAFQDFVRFELALQESVGVGSLPRAGDAGVVGEALARADGSALLERLPDGLATRVGTRFTGGRELSGGEWQRVALARGLMRPDPLLVVLDEPTASLDAAAEAALFDRYAAAARRLGAARGTITLLVSHRFSTARAADLIVVLEDGRVIETGAHAELMAARGTYAELFTLQARAYA